MAFVGSNNPLAWAHFRLRGGWARSLIVTAGGLLLVAGVIVTMYRLNPGDEDRVLFGWTTGLLALQAACLVLYIPGRIGTVIRADVQSKMIESHRLMPLPPAHAVAGYIMGAATQPLVFCGGVFCLGALVAAGAGVHLPRWAFANGVLLVFAAFVWTIAAYTSLGGRAGGGILAALIIIPYASQGFVLALLPGTAAILSPVMGQSVFDLRTAGLTLPATYAIAFAAQFCFAALCFVGAAREYRSPVEISLDTLLGLGFLLGWVAVSFAALRAWDDFRPRGWDPGTVTTDVQVVASLIAALLIAIAPVAANARERDRWRRHVALRDPYPARRPLPIAAVLAAAVIAILAVPFAPAEMARPAMAIVLLTAAVMAIALVGLYFLFDWLYAFTRNAAVPATMWILLTWGGPIAVDVARDMAEYGTSAGSGRSDALGAASAASPAGALILLWTGAGALADADLRAGIGVQILFALVPMCLWLIRFRGRLTGVRS